jgi:DNA processing protein
MDKGLYSSPTPFTPPTTEDDRLSWLRLIRSRRVGPATFHRLLCEHGSAAAALAALPDVARSAGLDRYEPCPEGVARAELAAARRLGLRMLCRGEAGYPPALATLPDAPPVLWVQGDAALLARPAVAIVGARNASSLGLRMARRLAEGLAAEGIVVVSGLARGIDAAAHAAALGSGTVAVMAGGTDVIYPAENGDLAAAIAAQGARISEQPPGFEAQARHFPQRNRIVAGMALGVVVVEAADRSGSLITARTALDLGREVLAVPGHPVDARAAGCNALIRDGATLVRSAADVIEALAPALAEARLRMPAPPPPAGQPATREAGVLGRLLGSTGARGAAIARRLSAPDAAISVGIARDRARPPSRPAAAAPAGTPAPPPAGAGGRKVDTRAAGLHHEILARLGPSPIAEDQLIRDLDLPPGMVSPVLLELELDGAVQRQPGGLLARTTAG